MLLGLKSWVGIRVEVGACLYAAGCVAVGGCGGGVALESLMCGVSRFSGCWGAHVRVSFIVLGGVYGSSGGLLSPLAGVLVVVLGVGFPCGCPSFARLQSMHVPMHGRPRSRVC